MIIDIHQKYDVSPEWFGTQVKNEEGWIQHLCWLFSAYKVHDEAGAKEVAELMIKAGADEKIIKAALE